MVFYVKRGLFWGAFIIGGYLFIRYVLPFFVPFILALGFSLFMEPLVKSLQNKFRLSRGFAVAIVMVSGLGTLLLLISLLIFTLITELVELSYQLPRYQENMEAFISTAVAGAKNFYYWKLSPDLIAAIHQNLGAITESFKNFIISAVDSFLSFIYVVPRGITGGITIMIVSLIATFFISRDKELLLKLWLKITPGAWGFQTLKMAQEMVQAFSKYLKAQLILISITTILTICGLFIIGAKYALTMGLVTGLFDLIPVLGPSIVFIPWIIWSFLTGSSIFAIKLVILYALIIGARQVLETKVVADSLGLHPLATLIAIYLGLKVFGVMGMIIGPLTIIAFQAALNSGVIRTIHIKK